MNQTEQTKRIEKLERQVMLLRSATGHDAAAIIKLRGVDTEYGERIKSLWEIVIEHAEHIEQLEERAARDRTQVIACTAATHDIGSAVYASQQRVAEQTKRIEKLEAALGPWLEEMVAIMDSRDNPSRP